MIRTYSKIDYHNNMVVEVVPREHDMWLTLISYTQYVCCFIRLQWIEINRISVNDYITTIVVWEAPFTK